MKEQMPGSPKGPVDSAGYADRGPGGEQEDPEVAEALDLLRVHNISVSDQNTEKFLQKTVLDEDPDEDEIAGRNQLNSRRHTLDIQNGVIGTR